MKKFPIKYLLIVLLSALLLTGTAAIAQDDDEDTPDSLYVEIEGTVEVLEDDSIIVNGYEIAPASAFRPSMLKVGDEVVILGYFLNDDTFKAVSLEVVYDDEDVTEDGLTILEGVVEVIDDDSLIIGGFEIAPAGAFSPSVLEVSDEVILTGYFLNDETFKVVSIEFVLGDDVDDEDVDDEEDVDDDSDDEEMDDSACDVEAHPVAMTYAENFGVSYDVIIGWHCDGFGMGEIGRALLLAEEAGDAEAILMQARESGWGKIIKEYEGSPADLASGKVISAKGLDDLPPGLADRDEDDLPPGLQKKDDEDKVPPGQAKKDENKVPPGQAKDKGKGPKK